MRYVARLENDELFILPISGGATVAVGVGATLYDTWEDLLIDHPDAEEPSDV